MSGSRLLSTLPAPQHHHGPSAGAIDPFLLPSRDRDVRSMVLAMRQPASGGGQDGGVLARGRGTSAGVVELTKGSNRVLPLTMDGEGNIRYDAIVRQNENAVKTVFTQHSDLVPKIQDQTDEDLQRPDAEVVSETTQRTKLALEKLVNAKISAAQPSHPVGIPGAPTYIKYTPSQQGAAFNSGAKERIIRLVEMPKDPLEPPKFKHKRVPKASGSPPVPVMHSPPRPVTVKDQQDWKIPPCISNWKNPKGYTIPLDKRLAADGRGLQEVQINDNFAKLSEALYVAEQKAREAVEMRSKIQRDIMLKDKEKKEQQLRQLAERARLERAGGAGGGGPAAGAGAAAAAAAAAFGGSGAMMSGREVGPTTTVADGQSGLSRGGGMMMEMDARDRGMETKEEREERIRRDSLREERKRERERERRQEAKEGGKRSKITRDRDRDISEKVALGQVAVGNGGQVEYDQRLFNQDQGMDSGFATDDQYNVYDKGLFARAHPSAGGLYRPNKDADGEAYGGEQLETALKTDRFRPDKGFAGAREMTGAREQPVEFERNVEEADPFGLDQFLVEVKKGKKALDKIGTTGALRAGGGAGTRETYEGGSSRTRVDFQRGR